LYRSRDSQTAVVPKAGEFVGDFEDIIYLSEKTLNTVARD